ncbi:xanthine dehydrogenase family protein molybdopterin-binding subunit [Sphingosinicella terrae]|uniref:xanthine dehydrogenase family protein molybdopterin-binding subunit n=1 Tax=Sphingosinicella terrae TaxID=2172047 RepID=UPI000E0CEDA6|nr:xanthine dehydrogenase family protein molybdopterin-binding subunit [Sphingosinicella terrae]
MAGAAISRSGIGAPVDRVEGRLKVTGAAKYAAEFNEAALLHGHAYASRITKGRIAAIDPSAALAVPGVLDVLTHENRPDLPLLRRHYQDEVASPGIPFVPLWSDKVLFAGQPVALVVAETAEIARYASSLLEIDYEEEPHETDLKEALHRAAAPWRTRKGYVRPKSRGDAPTAFEAAAVRIDGEYHLMPEHHNPMELFGTTVVRHDDGRLTIYDKTQGALNSRNYISKIFGYGGDEIQVLSPFVGGAFGAALRPQHQLFLAVLAARHLERSVRVVMTRQEMWSLQFRPECYQWVKLGAEPDGRLAAIVNHAVTNSSRLETYTDNIVSWGGMLYRCDNADLEYRIAETDTMTPGDMRAPGAATGVNLFEIAMDELAYAAGVDPLELRLRNYAEKDEMHGIDYTSKALRECYAAGAERFGWARRVFEPRSMREGRELIGWGMATGIWEAMQSKTACRATLRADGRLEVATGTADIGPGTYTMMVQVAAERTGLPAERIEAKLGDSTLPYAPVQGGSWTAASTGSAVALACETLRTRLYEMARDLPDSPFASTGIDDVRFEDGEVVRNVDPMNKRMRFEAILEAAGCPELKVEETAKPGMISMMRKARNSHSAVFAEVRVDEELGVMRVTRIVSACAAGRIINPKIARSQILGGIVFGLGMALEEESMMDHRLGRFMNHDLAEYHVPVNADLFDVDIIFVEEQDEEVNPLGVKGVGELGVPGTAAAIANAVFHATGKRIRDLPITIDKLL